MNKRFSSAELYAIRNEIDFCAALDLLGLPRKESEGVQRFLCPKCGEFQTGINPRTNLGRCFRCAENFNTIELVMAAQRHSFVEAVKLLRLQLPLVSRR